MSSLAVLRHGRTWRLDVVGVARRGRAVEFHPEVTHLLRLVVVEIVSRAGTVPPLLGFDDDEGEGDGKDESGGDDDDDGEYGESLHGAGGGDDAGGRRRCGLLYLEIFGVGCGQARDPRCEVTDHRGRGRRRVCRA